MLNDRSHKEKQFIPHMAIISHLLRFSLAAVVSVILASPMWAVDASPVTQSEKPDLYNVDASGTDIKLVLKALARQSGVNMVISPDITGLLNMHVKQQSLLSILDSIAAIMDVACKSDGVTYLITPKSKLVVQPEVCTNAPIPATTIFVWICHNVEPSQLITVVTKLFPSINAVLGPEALMPKYSDETMSSTSSAGQSISDYSGGGTAPNTASPVTLASSSGEYDPKKHRDRIVLMGPVADVERAKQVIKQLDVEKRQVNIELAITEIQSTGDNHIGVDWNWDPFSVKQGYTTPSTDTTSAYNSTNVNVSQPKFALQPWNFGATLSAMVKDGTANLLANPNISLLDGESGRIFLGDTVRYLQLDSRDRDGRPIYKAATVDAGISLPIAVRILPDDSVILNLHPAISLITGYSTIEGSQYPQVSIREVQTTVIIKNGEMLAIGGLIRDEDTRNASRIPLMGNLPVIGGLFRSRSVKKQKTELIILLKLKIIE